MPERESGQVRLPESFWRKAAVAFQSLGSLAPLIYLATALPTVLFLTILVPPFQTPDETNHFRRAVQLMRGQVVGHDIPSPGWSGAELPKNVVTVAESFSYLIAHPEAKFSSSIMKDMRTVPWDWSDREFTSFANTVIYPPFFYMPAVLALSVARNSGWDILDSYELARVTTGLVAVLLSTAAVCFTVHGRAIMVVLLSLPTTLFLFASVSQDALLIACVALGMALCSHAAAQERSLALPARFMAAVFLGAAMGARPPYVFLLPALAAASASSKASLTRIDRPQMTSILPVIGALVLGLAWIVLGARPSQTPMRLEAGVSVSGQLAYIIDHIGAFPAALLNTLREHFSAHLAQALGVIGWSETFIAFNHYCIVAGALAIALGQALFVPRGPVSVGWGIALTIACGMSLVGLYGALYLSWTPVGAAYVDGFQGRYLVPASTLLVLAVPAVLGAKARPLHSSGRLASLSGSVAWMALFALVAISDFWLLWEVFARYYD